MLSQQLSQLVRRFFLPEPFQICGVGTSFEPVKEQIRNQVGPSRDLAAMDREIYHVTTQFQELREQGLV